MGQPAKDPVVATQRRLLRAVLVTRPCHGSMGARTVEQLKALDVARKLHRVLKDLLLGATAASHEWAVLDWVRVSQ
jgi:hypothetical protein